MSRPTFTKVRNKLKQRKVIDFTEGSRGEKPTYILLYVANSVNIINTTGNITGNITGDHDIRKRYKTKTKIFSKKR